MRWRTLMAVLIGTLLPLPLVWLLYVVLSGSSAEPVRLQRLDVVPMLTPGERLGVLTYGRECRTDADCDVRLRCFFSMLTQDSTCMDSRCMTDAQCAEGFTCRTYTARNGKDLLNACTLVGERKEGEACEKLTRRRLFGCARDLLCHDRCGRPCQVDDPTSCPEGYFCRDEMEGPACQPTCAGRTCPEGQQCVSTGPDVSVCATVHGQNCQRTQCAQDQSCSLFEHPQRVGEVWITCRQRCGPGEDDPRCPEGTVCHWYQCLETCAPEDPSACGPGLSCNRREDDVWLCTGDYWKDGEG